VGDVVGQVWSDHLLDLLRSRLVDKGLVVLSVVAFVVSSTAKGAFMVVSLK
jgi:hypothetical protein